MAHAGRTCIDCPAIIRTGRRCPTCESRRRHHSDQARRPDGNPYATPAHRAFRRVVLARDPICTVCRAAWSTVADHHPHSRRDLIATNLDPNNPQYGRGLCKRCHDRETAKHQPGGWAATRHASNS